jgi:hypothetical protein
MDLLNGLSNSSDMLTLSPVFISVLGITFVTVNCFAVAVPENNIKRHRKITIGLIIILLFIFDLLIFSPQGNIRYLPNRRYNWARITPMAAIITQSLMLESSVSCSIFWGSSL